MTHKEQISADVKKHGWSVFKITDELLPPFAYTVGLYANFNHPEIMLSGVHIDAAQDILNGIGSGIKAGQTREENVGYDDVLAEHDCIFKSVSIKQYDDYSGQAMVFYDDKQIPVLQCVYPDSSGCFLWEAGYQLTSQELLY